MYLLHAVLHKQAVRCMQFVCVIQGAWLPCWGRSGVLSPTSLPSASTLDRFSKAWSSWWVCDFTLAAFLSQFLLNYCNNNINSNYNINKIIIIRRFKRLHNTVGVTRRRLCSDSQTLRCLINCRVFIIIIIIKLVKADRLCKNLNVSTLYTFCT